MKRATQPSPNSERNADPIKNLWGKGLLYGGVDAAVYEGLGLWAEDFKIALLDSVLAGVVDDEGALLRLLAAVAADVHQGVNDPFKGVDVVIPNDDFVGGFGEYRKIFLVLLLPLGGRAWENRLHRDVFR